MILSLITYKYHYCITGGIQIKVLTTLSVSTVTLSWVSVHRGKGRTFLSFFNFWFLRKTFENIKCVIGGELLVISVGRFRFRSYYTKNNLIHSIAIFKFFPYFLFLSLAFEIPLKDNWYLQLDRYYLYPCTLVLLSPFPPLCPCTPHKL